MSGAISQLIGHLWGEIVKHGPTVRPFASANAEGLSTPTRHPLIFNDGPSRFAYLRSPLHLSGASPGMPS